MPRTADVEPSLDRAVSLIKGTSQGKDRRLSLALFKTVFEFAYTRGQYILHHKADFAADYRLICQYVPYFETDASKMEPWQDAIEVLQPTLDKAYTTYTQLLVQALNAHKKKAEDAAGWNAALAQVIKARHTVEAELDLFRGSVSFYCNVVTAHAAPDRIEAQATPVDFSLSTTYAAATKASGVITGEKTTGMTPGDFVVDDDEEIETASLPSSDEAEYSEEESDEESEEDIEEEAPEASGSGDQDDSGGEDTNEIDQDARDPLNKEQDEAQVSEPSESGPTLQQKPESPDSNIWDDPEKEKQFWKDFQATVDDADVEDEPDSEDEEVQGAEEEQDEDIEEQKENEGDAEETHVDPKISADARWQRYLERDDPANDTHININDGVTIGTNRTLAHYPYYQTSTVESALAWDGSICFVCFGHTNALDARMFFGEGYYSMGRWMGEKHLICRLCRDQFTRGKGDITIADLKGSEWSQWSDAKRERAKFTARECEACGIRTTSFLDPLTEDDDDDTTPPRRKPTICHSCQLFREIYRPPHSEPTTCIECDGFIKQPFWHRHPLRGPNCAGGVVPGKKCLPFRYQAPALPWARVSHRTIGQEMASVVPTCVSCGTSDRDLKMKWTSDESGQPQCFPCWNELQGAEKSWLRWPLTRGECQLCDVVLAPIWHILPSGKGEVCHWCLFPRDDERRFRKPKCIRCKKSTPRLRHRTFAKPGEPGGSGIGEMLCESCVKTSKRARDDEDDERYEDAGGRRPMKRRKIFDPFACADGVDDPTRFWLW